MKLHLSRLVLAVVALGGLAAIAEACPRFGGGVRVVGPAPVYGRPVGYPYLVAPAPVYTQPASVYVSPTIGPAQTIEVEVPTATAPTYAPPATTTPTYTPAVTSTPSYAPAVTTSGYGGTPSFGGGGRPSYTSGGGGNTGNAPNALINGRPTYIAPRGSSGMGGRPSGHVGGRRH